MNTARTTALLLLLNIKLYGEDRHKPMPRVRKTRKMVARIAERVRLRESFISDLADELLALGYILIPLPEGFAFIPLGIAEGFTTIATRRINAHMRSVRRGEMSDSDLIAELGPWGDNSVLPSDDEGE